MSIWARNAAWRAFCGPQRTTSDAEVLAAVELVVLEGVDDVEPDQPEEHRAGEDQGQQPKLSRMGHHRRFL
jgi:hypothetical protein